METWIINLALTAIIVAANALEDLVLTASRVTQAT
jgi:hypothetical protein